MMQVEKQIPETFTKVVLLDGDILFASPTWYDTVSKLLDSSDVVRPFKIANCMDLTYKKIESKVSSVHPGYAWAFQRKSLRTIGIYENAVMGGGDTVLECKVFCKPVSYLAYKKDVEIVPLGLTQSTADITIYHMYHGQIKNRQYSTRHDVLLRLLLQYSHPSISYMLERREDGIMEWKLPYRATMNRTLLTYFTGRKEDD